MDHTLKNLNKVVTTVQIMVCLKCAMGPVPDVTSEALAKVGDCVKTSTKAMVGKFVIINKKRELCRWSKSSFSRGDTDTEHDGH